MKLLLCGGGAGEQNTLANQKLDEIITDHEKPLLYVPFAMSEEKYSYSNCFEWITGELKDVDIPAIEMVTTKKELATKTLSDYCAIFIGGGNTYKLLSDLKTSKAFVKIKEFIDNDGIIIGGSAGAIIFGFNIDCINYMDSNDVGLVDTKGFDVLDGISIAAHYTNESKEKTKIATEYLSGFSLNSKVIALPEEDAIFVDGNVIEVIGTKPYYVFENGKVTKLEIKFQEKSLLRNNLDI